MNIGMSCCLGATLWLGATATLAAAQEPVAWLSPRWAARTETTAVQSLQLNDWRRLLDLPTGTELRVSVERARVLKGKLVNVTDEALTLRVAEADLGVVDKVVESHQVVRVHRIQRDSLKNGTLIGLAVGSGVGAGLGALARPISADDKTEERRIGTGLGLYVGAGVGALIGAAADNARVDLILVYERPPQTD